MCVELGATRLDFTVRGVEYENHNAAWKDKVVTVCDCIAARSSVLHALICAHARGGDADAAFSLLGSWEVGETCRSG